MRATTVVACGADEDIMINPLTEIVDQASLRSDIPEFHPGDSVRVHVRVIEGGRSRAQVFTGIVIARNASSMREAFTVRKISFGVETEHILPLHNPAIGKIEVERRGNVRRAKLYYLRGLRDKAVRIKEKRAWGCLLGPHLQGGTRWYGSFVFSRKTIALEDTEESSTGATQERSRSLSRRFFSGIGEVVTVLVGTLLISAVLRDFVTWMFSTSSGGMENTLKVGNRVLVTKFGGSQRGDIVVFEDPVCWLLGPQPEHMQMEQALGFVGMLLNSGAGYLIKHVIGMPGNWMACCTAEGAVAVNGEVLDELQCLYSENEVQVTPSTMPFSVIAPASHIFMLGDHRNASTDSRCHLGDTRDDRRAGSTASVPRGKVMGAAMAVVAPLDRLSTFRVPEIFAKTPEPERGASAKPTIIEAPTGC